MPERVDVFQVRLGLRLHGFRHGVEHVGGLVNPAALNAGLAINLMQGRPFGYSSEPVAVMPSPHRAIAHCQFRGRLQPPAFQVQQQFAPALGAFAEAVDEAQNVLVAPFVCYRQWFARKPREARR